ASARTAGTRGARRAPRPRRGPRRPTARGAGAARPARRPAPRASGPAPAAAPAAPSAARRAGTAPRAPPGTPRTPPRAAAPTRTLPRPRALRRHPSYSASSCDSFIEQPPQPDVGARQLRLGKTHRLAHLLRDLLVRVALHLVEPYHRTRCLAQPLERPLEIDLGRHRARAHSAHAAPRPHPHDRLLVQLFRLPPPVLP